MGILEYLLIGVAGLVVIWVLSKLLKKKKKAKKATKEQAPEQKKEEPKEEPKPEPDRSFKIAKKSRLSRVSKKALETNSRTATVEKVFERTPPMPSSTQTDVYVEPLEPESQQLLDSLSSVETTDRKVISVKELKQHIQPKDKSPNTDYYPSDEEEYSSARYISSGRAGEITGQYTGIHLGSSKPQTTKPQHKGTLDNTVVVDDDEDIDFEKLFDSGMFGSSSFTAMERNGFKNLEQPKPDKSDDIDFNDMVVAEAMLNPKYKKKSRLNKK